MSCPQPQKTRDRPRRAHIDIPYRTLYGFAVLATTVAHESATDRLPTDPASSLAARRCGLQRCATTPLVATPVSPLDLAQLAPGRPLLHLDEERHAQLRRLLHATPHERAQPWRVGHAPRPSAGGAAPPAWRQRWQQHRRQSERREEPWRRRVARGKQPRGIRPASRAAWARAFTKIDVRTNENLVDADTSHTTYGDT